MVALDVSRAGEFREIRNRSAICSVTPTSSTLRLTRPPMARSRCARAVWSFGKVVPDAITQEHGIAVRHDIKDGTGKPQRGWRGLKLIRADGPSSEIVSEVSERTPQGTI